MQLKFANITKWGPKAEAYMRQNPEMDIGMFVEHHLTKDGIRGARVVFESLGWYMFAT